MRSMADSALPSLASWQEKEQQIALTQLVTLKILCGLCDLCILCVKKKAKEHRSTKNGFGHRHG